ncbi:Uncharacterised protein [uncultured archaeon]|nr:Uncharacterised protein [uncultured archaeon]
MSVRLEQIVPQTVLSEAHRHWEERAGEPVLPSLDFIAPPPIPNPLLSMDLDDVGMARRFMDRIERSIMDENRAGSKRPWLTPTTTPDEELIARLAPPISQAASAIAQWLNQDCRGDMGLMQRVLDRFWAKWAVERFQSPDLSSLLLIAYEEVLLEESGHPTSDLENWPALRLEPAILQPLHEPMAIGVQSSQILVAEMGEESVMGGGRIAGVHPAVGPRKEDEIEVRLVSVREMLRSFFQSRPHEYAAALSAALNLQRGDWDSTSVSARLAGERARLGTAGVCERLWQEVRMRHSQPPAGPDDAHAWGAAPLDEEHQVWRLATRWLPLRFEHKLRLLLGWILS